MKMNNNFDKILKIIIVLCVTAVIIVGLIVGLAPRGKPESVIEPNPAPVATVVPTVVPTPHPTVTPYAGPLAGDPIVGKWEAVQFAQGDYSMDMEPGYSYLEIGEDGYCTWSFGEEHTNIIIEFDYEENDIRWYKIIYGNSNYTIAYGVGDDGTERVVVGTVFGNNANGEIWVAIFE